MFPSIANSKKRIQIIEYFISHKENSSRAISEALGMQIQFVHATVNKYGKDKTVIIQSKMNFDNSN
jgi:DNA-binding transcriptional regulator LsrR (DeoR family)